LNIVLPLVKELFHPIQVLVLHRWTSRMGRKERKGKREEEQSEESEGEKEFQLKRFGGETG
jgi:hypothetical protein